MSNDDRRAFSNLMLMCVAHHNLIDRLEPERHPVELLLEWKEANEPEDGMRVLAPRLSEASLVRILEDFTQDHRPIREIKVGLLGGLVTHADGVTAGPLEALPALLDLNPYLRQVDRVLVADINNVGTISVVVDAVDFLIKAEIKGKDEAVEIPFKGRNDYAATNPPLPFRLQDGGSFQWFVNIDSVLLLESIGAMRIREIAAIVRLGSGEQMDSSFVTWPSGLSATGP